jgi:glutamate racemase
MPAAPIGIFDSGYGGLTVMKEIVKCLPQYDYLYLGDNARAPYGTRSFESIYQYTLECVKHLFDKGCPLIILACNTASARALRNIQQKDLAHITPTGRVLGIIRPTAEIIGEYTRSQHIGVVGTSGTVKSESYVIEINKIFPDVTVHQEACPMWVPLVENDECAGTGTDYFVKKHLDQLFNKAPLVDTILLGCTHYPLLQDTIQKFAPAHVKILSQGKIVAQSLANYLQRHPEIEQRCSRTGKQVFTTTDSTELFDAHGSAFYGRPIASQHVSL